ncbi:pterin 4 alpha carbinolamine dehydratase-domain-containing protein [Microdochium bolleyi]|uniref:4a-hydroxytetrahydrobiopterin dehydratase n=1 Tax=Microdochium bolleyi TaxID=196109 RepID=A0A136JE03_9PEZI|nr:pterin 4 alpha carbinolamine dehydratase-domain-containing protein [Microdochium bolleyi]
MQAARVLRSCTSGLFSHCPARLPLATAAAPRNWSSHARSSQPQPPVRFAGRRMVSSQAVSFSKGVDEAAMSPKLQALLATADHGGRWALIPGGHGLERSFKFKTFAKTWDFMTAVSLQCKIKNHHPEWSNVYNTTYIRWTTHEPRGLSAKDIELAAICDQLAKDFGELQTASDTTVGGATTSTADAGRANPPPDGISCEIRGLADRVASGAGDCCVPKSKKSANGEGDATAS